MRKNQTSYSDAMNEWAAKQSGLRKRRNRLLHPKPDQPGPLRALGYLVRIAIVIFLVWLVGAKLSANYYNGDAFNQKLRAEIKAMTRADALDASDFTWRGSQASCEKLIATGGESAFFRNLEATQVSFSLPLLKRLRPSWAIDHLSIERLSLALNSGSQPEGGVGASPLAPQPLVPAGLLPSPDLSRLILARITCDATDVSWGHSSATRGALKGAEIGLFSASEDWHLDIEGGVVQQNWLRGMAIESLTVRRKGGRLILSDSEIRPGGSEETGTLEGEIVLGGLPQLDLRLELPAVETSDLLPEGSDLAQFFNGLLRLSTQLSGSIHGPTGVETSSKATLTRGMFGKIPVFEAIDELLGTNTFQRFSPDTGEVEFTTAGGRLEVSRFECKSRSASALLRGTFSYASDEISGRLQLGVRPSLLSNNEVAMSFFTERAEGYVWIGIPLKGTLEQATRPQQAEILAALRRENP